METQLSPYGLLVDPSYEGPREAPVAQWYFQSVQ